MWTKDDYGTPARLFDHRPQGRMGRMSRVIPADGPSPCRVLFVGERPGGEEYEQGQNFVGPAGQELWSRVFRTCRLEREDCRVANLVPTFSVKPPSDAEIREHKWRLVQELADCRPEIIVAVGAHAARWFLPRFANISQDIFHGLPFYTQRCKGAIVLPVVHSAAALRQPDLYQHQLTSDLRQLKRLLDRELGMFPRERTAPEVYQVGLAGFHKAPIVGLDTEGTVAIPEAVTLCADNPSVACIETWSPDDRQGLETLRTIVPTTGRLVIHNAKHDLKVLWNLHMRRLPPIDCTMLMAYLLGYPQALKTLAYRLLGYQMGSYEDLVQPLDDQLVREQLKRFYDAHIQASLQARTADRNRNREAACRSRSRVRGGPERGPARDRTRHSRGPSAQAQSASDARSAEGHQAQPIPGAQTEGQGQGKGQAEIQTQVAPSIPPRAFTSIRGVLTKGTDRSLRDRWEGSKFTGLVPLPPPPTWRHAEKGQRYAYAMTDALAHRNLGAELRPQIVEAGLEHIYRIDKSVLPFLVRHELVGMKVNEKALPRLSAKFEAEYTRACARLADIAGHPVNPEAHEEVSDVLFKELGITPTKPTKTGFYTTQKKYLQARQKEHEAVGLVIHARHMTKLKSTYTDRLPSLLRDGRYHADWKYTRTASGRMAEEIILLIPKHSPFATYVRNVFIPDEGQILVSCDLSQIEMRVMAHESRDPIFMRAYRTGVDMHAQTAWELLGAPKKAEQQDESKHRLPAKILNFGVLMGMTEYGVYEQLQASGQSHWQVEELTDTMREQGFKSTTEFRREWFALYAGVGAWVEQKKAEGRRRGYVRDMWGRRIEVSGIWSTNSRIRAEFERKAHAIPIQSGAIGIAKRWVSRVEKFVLRKHRGKVEPFVWVHDDITLRVNEDQAQEVQGQVLALVPDDLCVPTTADAKTGYAWGNLH